jgi:hypothetical protein
MHFLAKMIGKDSITREQGILEPFLFFKEVT